jgi:hypothetical protein
MTCVAIQILRKAVADGKLSRAEIATYLRPARREVRLIERLAFRRSKRRKRR